MAMKTVEKMARADAEFAGRDYDALGRADKRRFIERAAVMLSAAREPSEAMTSAPYDAELDIYWIYYSAGTPGSADDVWRAMIDAAIEEATE